MKFGALLRSSAEHSPELQGLFVCYKQLKKKIKQLPVGQVTGGVRDGRRAELAEASFVQIINADVLQFNDLFIEREEDCVIRLGSIEDAAQAASTPAEIAQVYRRSVNLHGQLLLMVHWSILAYTGLVKILKKHYKRTGLPVQAPHLDNLLTQPFCSVELLGQLVRQAEAASQQLAERLRSAGHAAEAATTRSSASSIDELILAAQSSVQEMAADSEEGSCVTPQDVPLPLDGLAPPAAKRPRVAEAEAEAAPAAAAAPAASTATGPPAQAGTGAEAPVRAPQPESTAGASVPNQPTPEAVPPQQAGNAPGTLPASRTDGAPAAAATAATEAGARRNDPGTQASTGATILRQTQAALGLWESLHENAVTPSTVLQPHRLAMRRLAVPMHSVQSSHLDE